MLVYLLSEATQHPTLAALVGLLTLWLLDRVYKVLRARDAAKIMMGVITVATALSIAAFFGSLHYAKVSKSGTRSDLTTDQVLAALSTNITILGGILAVAALGTGIGAVFGYAELRTATMRKTEDHLIKLIQTMRKRGDLDDATASVLLESVVPDRVIVLRVPTDESKQASAPSNGSDIDPAQQHIAQQYPEENDDRAAK
jgi:hypothetical protein